MTEFADAKLKALANPRFRWKASVIADEIKKDTESVWSVLEKSDLRRLASALFGVASSYEKDVLRTAYFEPDQRNFEVAISNAIQCHYLVQRSLREHQLRSSEDRFTSSTDDLVQLLMIATWLGHSEASQWLGSDFQLFARDADWNETYAHDTEYLRFCSLVSDRWSLTVDCGAIWPASSDSIYAALEQTLKHGTQARSSDIESVWRARTARSYAVEIEGEDSSFHYSSEPYNALFPFELFSFRRVLDEHGLLERDNDDGWLPWFDAIRFDRSVTSSALSVAVEQRIRAA